MCEDTNDQNSETNCKQLNGASAYFDGGLVEMRVTGTHHVVSTRNNDFTNRAQKAQITVTGIQFEAGGAIRTCHECKSLPDL